MCFSLNLSCYSSLVDRILDILNQPISGIIGSQPHVPQITDLSQITSDAIQGSGDIDTLEPSPINLPPTVSFVNGKHEVLSIQWSVVLFRSYGNIAFSQDSH